MPDVVVVGAGISGLTCAWQLRSAGLDVLVLEAKQTPGGVMSSHKVDGFLVESGPNTILPTPRMLTMVNQLGLSEDLVTVPPKSPRFMYFRGRLRKVPLGVLSVPGMLRALGEPLVSRRVVEEETLASFFTRRFGSEIHDRLAAPFVTGIWAGDTERLSVDATFPRLVDLESRYGSVILGMLRRPRSGPRAKLAAFRDGMGTLPLRLAHDLDVRFGVDEVQLDSGLGVEWNSDGALPKAIVLACPAFKASRLARPVSNDLADLLDAVPYAPMLVAATSLDDEQLGRPLHGFGFLVPRSEELHILGTLFSSSLFPNRAPAGSALLTSFLGGALEPDAIRWSDERVWETVTSELKRVLGPKGNVEPVRLFRQERAIPQYGIGHRKWLANVKGSLEGVAGLFLTGSYLEGVSVPASMQHGRETADAVVEYIRR